MSCSNSGRENYACFAGSSAVGINGSSYRVTTNVLIRSSLSPSGLLRNTNIGDNNSCLTGSSGTTHEGYESLRKVRTILGVVLTSGTGSEVISRSTGSYSVTSNFAVGAVCSRVGECELSVGVSCRKLGLTNIADHRRYEDSSEYTDDSDNNDELNKGETFHL